MVEQKLLTLSILTFVDFFKFVALMAKLFVFGIGGSGARVLRALTMFLASGVKVGVDKIVPIIIDPDEANADLTRTVTLMNRYRDINNAVKYGSPKDKSRADEREFFFQTNMEVSGSGNYKLQIEDTSNKTFEEFIGFSSMSSANQAITRMLFSDKNLEASMQVGFKGNPNIGSVVLNQLAYSEGFNSFASEFAQGDKIFIVSSIFGGTGASGFPLLLKTLREGSLCPNYALLKSAPIGAVTILPYFKIEQDVESAIDSTTFLSKARSALSYYQRNLGGERGVDAHYFLADEARKTYENHEGGSAQRNNAHLIEMLAATAIVDFSNYQPDEFQQGTKYYELGVKDNPQSSTIRFDSFYDDLHEMIYEPLVRFRLMANALTDNYNAIYSTQRVNANLTHFSDMLDSAFMRDLRSFLELYKQWTDEMEDNDRKLKLFETTDMNKPFEFVSGVKPKKSRWWQLKKNHEFIIDQLNTAVNQCASSETRGKYLEMFYRVTKQLVEDKLVL